MKKTISTMLIGSMLLMPIPVFATDDDNNLHSLRFDKIEEEMKVRNPTIEIQRENLWDGTDGLGDQEKFMKAAVDNLKNKYDALVNELKNNGTYIKVIDDPIEKKTFIFEATNPAPFATILPNYAGVVVIGAEPGSPAIPTDDVSKTDVENTINAFKNYRDYMNYNLLRLYSFQLSSLQGTLGSVEKQNDNMWKSYLQIDMAEDQIAWGAQQLYLTYYGLTQTKDNLQTNVTSLQKKLTAQQLKESLGLAIHTDVTATELQIKELNMTIDKLNQSMNDLKGQLNVMLGQDFDTELTLSEPSSVSQSKLRDMNYEEDLDDALVQSYNVRLKDDSDEIEDAERSFTLAFHQAYQNVQDKKKALELEQLKLNNEQLKYDQNILMNSLGLVSPLDFEGLRSLYLTQVNKVKTAQQDVLQAYTAYDWMKKGLTVSTGASTASASSSSTSAQTSGDASSGMGF